MLNITMYYLSLKKQLPAFPWEMNKDFLLYFLNCKHCKAMMLAFARVPTRDFLIEEHMSFISENTR